MVATGAFTVEQVGKLSKAAVKAALRQVPATYPGRVHLLSATLETTQWGWFDNAEAPVMLTQLERDSRWQGDPLSEDRLREQICLG